MADETVLDLKMSKQSICRQNKNCLQVPFFSCNNDDGNNYIAGCLQIYYLCVLLILVVSKQKGFPFLCIFTTMEMLHCV